MTLQAKTVADLSTSYADAQAGDLIPVERSGAMGKQTRAELTAGLLASPTMTGTTTIPTADINGGTIDGTVIGGTTPAAGTFTTLSATNGADLSSVSAAALNLRLTADADTHEISRVARENNLFILQTRNNANAFVSNDYVMTVGATGAATHSWRVANIERLYQDTNSLRTNNIVPLATGWNIGTANNGITITRFANIYLDNAPNVSSDARLKDNIADLTETERRAAAKIKARTFTMKDGGQKKVGYIAQEVIEAMASEGLCAFEYGLVSDGPTYGVDMDAINAFRLG